MLNRNWLRKFKSCSLREKNYSRKKQFKFLNKQHLADALDVSQIGLKDAKFKASRHCSKPTAWSLKKNFKNWTELQHTTNESSPATTFSC